MRKQNQANHSEYMNHEVIDNNTWESDLDVEVIDLDMLDSVESTGEKSEHVVQPTWSAQLLSWQGSFTRKRWRAVFVTGTLLLVGLLLFLNIQGVIFLTKKVGTTISSRFTHVSPVLTEHVPASIAINPSLVVSSQQLGFSCVEGEAWSPDSTLIAVLGYAMGCQNDAAHAVGYASILDAKSGRPLFSFTPDTPIEKAFASQHPTFHNALYIYYGSPSWSPDKQHLAFTFTILAQAVNSSSQFTGVLIYDTHSKNFRVFTQRNIDAPSDVESVSAYLEWDLAQGSIMSSPSYENDAPYLLGLNIPTAEGYAWGENGVLIPQTHKSASPNIGNTSGDPSFTIWQPGEISLIKQDAYGFTYAPGIFLWNVSFVAWSPDGRYLVQNAYTAARLELPGYPKPSQRVLAVFHLENIPVLPIRDKALLSALTLMTKKSTQFLGDFNNMFVVWSPNGKLMWMTSYSNVTMTLYTAHYGFPIATLSPQTKFKVGAQSSHEGYFSFSSPSWSPDGLHMLMQDPLTNAIVIWDVPHTLQ